MSQLALYLLGPLRIELSGEELDIPRRKALALLAYLAVERHSHRRDSLATLLWPDYDQSSARADLRRTLSLLNHTLGKGWLIADRETAGIDPDADVWLDVVQFRRRLEECSAHGHGRGAGDVCADCVPLLEGAVELYRGDFMAGFTLRDSLEFDEWQFFQTERLKDQLTSVVERLVRWYTENEDYERAIAYARRWLEHEALNEAVHRELMELYARAGQQTAALRQYQLCEKTLAEELGLPPSSETTTLYERIRAGEEIGREREVRTSIPHNLPPQPTPFIGREAELAELDELVADPNVRLITILGPGGVGKTRLGLAAAEEQLRATVITNGEHAPRFRDGIFFVSLAGLGSADQIVPSVVQALNYRLEGGERGSLASEQRQLKPRTAEQQLLDYLREKRMLLVFDNYEHLLDGVGLVANVLRTAPDVQVLVTSRERLLLHEEQAYPIQGLDFPDWERPDDLAKYSAARLFLQSAHRIQPSLRLGGDELTYLARICRLLEGLPLGIELAAGWVDTLSLADIATEIQRDLDFLETPWRDGPARHRSMRAVFDTSWRCLSEAEQKIFAQISVFRGGFTRLAAREVVGADLRDLARLVNKSLLGYSKARDRYDIHKLLHQYGSDRLAQDVGREVAARERHSAHYCAALERWEADLCGSRQLEASDEIDADIENIRAAWEWAATRRHVTQLGQAMDGLCQFLNSRVRLQEGETICQLACDGLAQSPAAISTEARRVLVKAMLWRSRFNARMGNWELANELLKQGQTLLDSPALADWDTRNERAQLHSMLGWAAEPDWKKARQQYEKWLALARELGHRWAAADALLYLADVELFSGEDDRARKSYQESLRLFRALGDHSGAVSALIALGYATRAAGDYDDARRKFDEGLALARAHGDTRRVADALMYSSWLALFLGDFQAGMGYLRESAALYRDAGDRRGLAQALANLSVAHWFSGEIDQAYLQIEESLAIAEDMQFGVELGLARVYRAWLDAAAGQYDEARTCAEKFLADPPTGTPYGFDAAIAQGVLGWTALARNDYGEARQSLREAITALQETRAVESREYTAWSLAALGRAAYGLGNQAKAQQHLFEALEIVVEIQGFIPLLHLMPIIPVVLADKEDPSLRERAVELYALAKSHPFVANSQLFEDIAGRHIRAATASLAPEVVATAQARGRALDWWETAAELLEELKSLEWGG